MLNNTQKPLIIGLTGNIGCGKSAVANILSSEGAYIIDADLLAREVVAIGKPALIEIRAIFGDKVIQQNGELDRKALGSIVFKDRSKLKQLEAITHPKIRALFLERLKNALSSNSNLIVYVVPLLFESGYSYPELNKVVVVSATKEICINRIMQRDSCSREVAEQRYSSQMPIEEKVKAADYVIYNNADFKTLETAAKGFLTAINSCK